ncbi:MAG: trigger factor [Coriobacteriia bacterium]|nr:trigger factor [Coriobacteriia bacterium]
MQVTKVEEKDGVLTLRIDLTADEVAEGFDKGLELFVQQLGLANLEGASAREKIEGALEPELAKETIESAVMSYFVPYALTDEKIIPISSADVKAQTILAEKLPFTFTLRVLPKPRYTLSDYTPFEVKVPFNPEITDELIDEQIGMLAKQVAEARAIDAGEDPDQAQPAEVTDEWCREALSDMGINSVEELRESFRKQSGGVMDQQFEQFYLAAVMEQYHKRLQGEITDAMKNAVAEDMFQALVAQVEQQGKTLEYYLEEQELTEEEARELFRGQAFAQLLQGFVLDAIYDHEDIKVEMPDLMRLLHQMAPGGEEQYFNMMQETKRTFLLMEGAERAKALEWIHENITVAK